MKPDEPVLCELQLTRPSARTTAGSRANDGTTDIRFMIIPQRSIVDCSPCGSRLYARSIVLAMI